MIINIRCWTCGKPIAHLWKEYNDAMTSGKQESRAQILDNLGLERYCCRASMMGHVELIDTVAQFKRF